MGNNIQIPHTDVDTDQIIASQYLLFPTIDEMKTHTFGVSIRILHPK